jgi:hypothetical protein
MVHTLDSSVNLFLFYSPSPSALPLFCFTLTLQPTLCTYTLDLSAFIGLPGMPLLFALPPASYPPESFLVQLLSPLSDVVHSHYAYPLSFSSSLPLHPSDVLPSSVRYPHIEHSLTSSIPQNTRMHTIPPSVFSSTLVSLVTSLVFPSLLSYLLVFK